MRRACSAGAAGLGPLGAGSARSVGRIPSGAHSHLGTPQAQPFLLRTRYSSCAARPRPATVLRSGSGSAPDRIAVAMSLLEPGHLLRERHAGTGHERVVRAPSCPAAATERSTTMGAHVSLRLAPCSRTRRRPARLAHADLRTDGAGVLRAARAGGGPPRSEDRLRHRPAAHTVRRIEKHLRRRGVLPGNEDDDLHGDPETGLAAAAVSGQVPPAGPQWAIRLRPRERRALAYDKPLCASMDGFTLHAATRAGALDPSGREALLHTCCARPLRRMRSSRARTAWSASSSRDPSPTAPSPP